MDAVVKLHGPIGDEFNGVTLASVIADVKAKIQAGATSLTVEIDSPGGILQTGFDIYNYLKSTGLPIKTVGHGIVASVATVIFMAGSTRVLEQGCVFMVHLPRLLEVKDATADQMAALSKEMKTVENKVIKFYTDHVELDNDTMRSLLQTEAFLTEDEAYKLGFTTAEKPLEAVAVLSLGGKPAKPNKMDPKQNEKAKGLLAQLGAKITAFLAGGNDPVMKVVYTADQQELNFPDLADDATPEPGAKVEMDGKPAEGTYTDTDGNTYVCEAGVLTTYTPADAGGGDDEPTLEEMQAKLTEANEKLAAAEAKVTEAEGQIQEMSAKLTEAQGDNKTLTKEVEQARTMVMEIQGLHSELLEEMGGKAPTGGKAGGQGKTKTKASMALKSYREARNKR